MNGGEWVPELGLGDRLRAVRRKRHRSQEEMAALLGVKKVTYASWEAGATPAYDVVMLVARRLHHIDNVPLWWTLGADDLRVPATSAPASLAAVGARSSTDRASDYGSGLGRFSPFRAQPGLPSRERRKHNLHVVPLTLVVDDRAVS